MLLKYRVKFQIKPGKWVFVPVEECKKNGKQLKKSIESKWTAPAYFYHLKKGGHVEALKAHMKNSHFIHIDIASFFNSINRSRVTRCLKAFFPYAHARALAIESTVKHPKSKKYILPYGFVQSPIIASLCLNDSSLGGFLAKLSKRKDIVLSVYVDDIIISAENNQLLKEILDELKKHATKAGFQLNDEKEEGPSVKITAFNIELAKDSLKLTKDRLDHFYKSYSEAVTKNKRNGILGYVNSVNKADLITFV